MQAVDLALIRNFKISESVRLQLRGETEGAMNHPNFAAPNTVPTSAPKNAATS